MLLELTSIAIPFYSVYAKNVLGAQAHTAGVYAAVNIGARLLSNLVLGWLSDRRGNRVIIRIVTTGRTLTNLLAGALAGAVAIFGLQGGWLPYLALPLFFLDGALLPAGILSGSNFLMELVPDAERPIYLGLTNTLSGIVSLISVLGGLLVDLLGFGGLFGTSAMLCLIGFALATGLPEPRDKATEQVSE
jgi:MFS family permease